MTSHPNRAQCSITTLTSPPGPEPTWSRSGSTGSTYPPWSRTLAPPVSPPILSGHGLDANDQIVIGSATLSLLHKHIGESVSVSFATREQAPAYIPPTRLVIVGTATFPAIGYSSLIADQPSMGTGALLSAGIEPPAWRKAVTNPDPILNGPQYVFVRLRNGVSASLGLADLRRIATAANKAIAADPRAVGSDQVAVLGVQRPAQIVNYRSIGTTPVLLAAGLAAGAIIALGLTLAASVRRRRRRPRSAQESRFHTTTALGSGRLPGHRRRDHRDNRGDTTRNRRRTRTVDPVRPQYQRCPRRHRAGLVGAPRRRGCSRLRQPRGGAPGARAAHTPTALVLRSE